MRRMLFGATLTLISAALLPPATAAPATTVAVDCNRGQTIANAFLQGDPRKALIVNIRGSCKESVVIDRDNVTLRGDPSATIYWPDGSADLVIVNANGLTLQNLTLTGGNFGVRQEHAVRVMITGCTIQDTAGNGIHEWVGDARVVNSTIQRAGGNGVNVMRGGTVAISGSQILDSKNSGIYVTGNAFVSVGSSTISGSAADGVSLQNGSVGTFSNTVISESGRDPTKSGMGLKIIGSRVDVGPGNSIINNPQNGVGVYGGGTAAISNNTISGNIWGGVFGYLGTTLNLYGNVITGNGAGVGCGAHCAMDLNHDEIQNNWAYGVRIEQGSALIINGPVNGTGNGGWGLVCADKESSVGGPGTFNGTVSNCTDFNN
jgi:hypothetical protein